MAIDQAHGQANAVIKGDGGPIGITEDPSALRIWMIGGPSVSQLVAQYEATSVLRDVGKQTGHHEQTERTDISSGKSPDVVQHDAGKEQFISGRSLRPAQLGYQESSSPKRSRESCYPPFDWEDML